MSESLEKLGAALEHLPILRSQFADLDDEKFQVLAGKGIFPYQYIDSPARMEEQQLPGIEKFYSDLTGCSVSQEEYERAQKVWSEFNIQNLGQYTDLYLKQDVLILADVFEEFCNSSMATYGLDPAHFYTAPGLSWSSMLKHTKVELELLDDVDMVLFIERGIRDSWWHKSVQQSLRMRQQQVHGR